MSDLTQRDFAVIVEKALKHNLQKAVYQRAMDILLEEFKAKAEPLARQIAESITLESVHKMAEYAKMHEELQIILGWSDQQ